MYLHGHGVPRDYRMALNYLKQASEKVPSPHWHAMSEGYTTSVKIALQMALSFLSLHLIPGIFTHGCKGKKVERSVLMKG